MKNENLNVKVGPIGLLDMLKFANLEKTREKFIDKTEPEEIKVNYPINNLAKAMHPDYQLFVVEKIIDHKDAGAKSLILKRKDGQPACYFRAGQYISLKFKIGDSFVTRPYSISSSPKWTLEGKIAVTVKQNKNGFASDWILSNLKVGDEVKGTEGLGHFYFEKFRDSKNVIALAGGSGITPFLSMAYAIRDGIEDFNLTILFGSRDEKSILFKDEFDEICSKTSKVKVVHVLSDEKDQGKSQYEYGFITADLIKKYSNNEKFSLFICGPEAMYKFLEKEVAKLNLEKKFIRPELQGVTKEVWTEKDYPADKKGKEFSLVIKQGPNEFKTKCKADEPILVAIEKAGIKSPSRCRSGECGWCRSRVLSGQVFTPARTDGRRWADKQGNHIHPCASFPLSDLVIVVPGEYF